MGVIGVHFSLCGCNCFYQICNKSPFLTSKLLSVCPSPDHRIIIEEGAGNQPFQQGSQLSVLNTSAEEPLGFLWVNHANVYKWATPHFENYESRSRYKGPFIAPPPLYWKLEKKKAFHLKSREQRKIWNPFPALRLMGRKELSEESFLCSYCVLVRC